MKVKTLHPDEIAFLIIEEGINNGYLARDISELIQERTEWDEKIVDIQIRTLLSRKKFYKQYVTDEMLGKLLFYTFEKPAKPVVKHVGSIVYADKFQNGSVLREAGFKTFNKSQKGKVVIDVPAYHFPKLVKVVPKLTRTKFSTPAPVACRFTRTKFPKTKLTRTK
jgi:hypothetical protein